MSAFRYSTGQRCSAYVGIRRLFFFVALAGLGFAQTFPVFAHPHMSLESRIEFLFDEDQCQGFWLEWTFDPFFSASIIQEYDRNKNTRFDKTEAAEVYQKAFSNLKKFGYFTYIRRGETRINPDGVQAFEPSVRSDRLVYRFFIDLSGKGYGPELSVAIFDSTYFCAVENKADGVSIKQKDADAVGLAWEIRKDDRHPIYYNPLGAVGDGTIYKAWKPGLETAYPEEIRVYR